MIALAAALVAGPALAQSTAAATPARENAYGVTTGSPLSSRSPAPTRGSAVSAAHLPAPGSATQRARSQGASSPGAGVASPTSQAEPLNPVAAPH